MEFRPHKYQDYAREFIIGHPVCALILDMGLGKTVITLTALWELALDYFEVGKVLVIAPFRVARDTWKEELEKWDHLKGLSVSVVVGSEKERLDALEKKASVYVINRENVVWLCEKHHWDFDMIVIDELSSFKSYQAKRFKALRRYRPKAIRVVGLTGTPGNLMDLWAEIGILDMGQRLGRYIGAYRDRFFLPDKRNRNIIYSYKPRDGAEEAIYNLISDICISMKAEDYLSMPECLYHRVEVRMDEKEEKLMLVDALRCELESAPRCFRFSSDGRFFYLLYELKNVIDVYSYETGERQPKIEKIQTISTTGPKALSQLTAASSMRLSTDEKHMFCGNAGDNTVTVYDRDPKTGLLDYICCLPISGSYPKDICVFPDDKHIASINHENGSITFFSVDYKKGLLIMNGKEIKVNEPNSCVIVKVGE